MGGGTDPGNRRKSLALLADLRHRGEQAFGVRVVRAREQVSHRRFLHDLAAVHHDDARRRLGDDAQIVRDEQNRRAEALLQIAEQLEDLRLDRDVERGRRLVGDDERWIQDERHRDDDALAHAAGELVRIFVGALRGGRECRPSRAFSRRGPTLPSSCPRYARARLRRSAPHLEDGVQRRHRFLEDHRHARAADLAHRALVERREVLSVEMDLAAGFDPSGRANQSEQRECGDRLAAARFANDAYRFAGTDLEADAVDCPRDTVLGVEVRAKVMNAKERLSHSPMIECVAQRTRATPEATAREFREAAADRGRRARRRRAH